MSVAWRILLAPRMAASRISGHCAVKCRNRHPRFDPPAGHCSIHVPKGSVHGKKVLNNGEALNKLIKHVITNNNVSQVFILKALNVTEQT